MMRRRRKSIHRSAIALALGLCLAPILGGCAANFGGAKKGDYAPKASVPNYLASTLVASGTDFQCASAPNVTRYYDPYSDGTGKYKVCVSKTDERILKISGRSHSPTGVVCLIPSSDANYSSYFGLRDAQNRIIHQCVTVSADGATVDFSQAVGSRKMNFLHAVEVEDLNDMLAHLGSFDVMGCPAARSYGSLPSIR